MDKKLTIRESFRLGKGWNLMIFAILARLVTNAGVNDGLNIALPAIAEGAGLDYELCLSMGTVAGFVGVAMMLVIAKFRDRFGGRKVSAALFIIFGLTFYFLFLRATNIVMYGLSQCIMVSCGQGCFYLCTGPMQSDWFPKKRGVVNGISTIGANIGTAVLAPIMTVLLTMAEYKNLTDHEDYVSDWTIPKMLRCKEVWLAAVVPGFITLGLLGIITQFVPRNTALGLSNGVAISAMTVAGLVGIVGSYAIGYIDTKLGTKKACMIYCGIFALGILFNLLATYWLPFVYISIFIVVFSLGGSTNMSLSFPA